MQLARRDDEDTLGQFFDECCVVEPWAQVKAADLLDAYVAWSGDKRMTTRRLTTLLEERGIEKYRNNGVRYRGIGLVSTDATDARTHF